MQVKTQIGFLGLCSPESRQCGVIVLYSGAEARCLMCGIDSDRSKVLMVLGYLPTLQGIEYREPAYVEVLYPEQVFDPSSRLMVRRPPTFYAVHAAMGRARDYLWRNEAPINRRELEENE